MATPDRLNWHNQAPYEVKRVLEASTVFMDSGGVSAPAGARGVVHQVTDHDIPNPEKWAYGRLYAAVIVQGDQRAADDDSAGQTDYWIDVEVSIGGKAVNAEDGRDRVGLLKRLQRAVSVIPYIISTEIGPGGGRFGEFSELAFYGGSSPFEEADDRDVFLGRRAIVRLQVTLVD